MAEWFIKLSLSLSLSLSLPWLYNTLTLHCLCFFLLLSTMALLQSTSLYHGSILDSTYFYHFSTSYYQPTLALIVSTSLDVILLLSTMALYFPLLHSTRFSLLDSTWVYFTIAVLCFTWLYFPLLWLYITLLDSTSQYHSSTWLSLFLPFLYFLNLTIHYSTLALLVSTWLYFNKVLLHSTWHYFTLPKLYFILLDTNSPYGCT